MDLVDLRADVARVFVYVGAESEARAVVVDALLDRVRVRDVTRSFVLEASPDISVFEAAERMIEEGSLAYALTRSGRFEGLLTSDAIGAVPPERRAQVLVRDIVKRIPVVAPTDEATRALRIMSEHDVSQIAIEDEGRLVGTVSREDIVRALKLRELASTQHVSARAA